MRQVFWGPSIDKVVVANELLNQVVSSVEKVATPLVAVAWLAALRKHHALQRRRTVLKLVDIALACPHTIAPRNVVHREWRAATDVRVRRSGLPAREQEPSTGLVVGVLGIIHHCENVRAWNETTEVVVNDADDAVDERLSLINAEVRDKRQ